MNIRIATFNLENLDEAAQPPDPNELTLETKIAFLRPQLERARADILCLQEVNGQERPDQPRALLALDQLVAGTQYAGFERAHTAIQSGEPFDERNLVILSRFPIRETRQFKHEFAPAPQYRMVMAIPPATQAKDLQWERPALHARIELPGGRMVHVVNIHLKSKIPSNIPGQKINDFTWRGSSAWAEGFFISSMKRVGQALEVRMFADQLFDADPGASIVICGDFNADLDDVPVRAIRGDVEDTGNGALAGRVLLPCERNVPESSRFSLYHQGRGEMIDHLLISRALLTHFRHTEIHNELLHDESAAFAFDTKFPESDHAPVIAEFDIP